MPFGPTHDLIRTLASWAINSYYSQIAVVNQHRVPLDGPIILASNHWNMAIDPAVLSACMPHGRRLHYWAKNTLFKNLLVNFILLDSGNIPVDRTTKNNQLLFKGTFDVLKLGECVAMFPEGTSYTQPKVIQVKDGVAWTVLEYAKNLRLTGEELPGTAGGLSAAPGPVKDVTVVVCGLNYTDKTRYRTRVQVEYAPPLALDAALVAQFMTTGTEKAAVKGLIREIEQRLRAVTVNADDWETLWCARVVREVVWRDGTGPLVRFRENMQQLVDLFALGQDRPACELLPVLRTDLLAYHRLLTAAHTTHLVFARAYPSRDAPARLIVELSRGLLRWPFFLLPAVAHVPVYCAAQIGGCLQPGEPESMDQNKAVSGLLVGLVVGTVYTHLVAAKLLTTQRGSYWAARTIVAYLVALTLVVIIRVLHDALVDTNYDAWRRVRLCFRLSTEERKRLWDAREKCENGWKAVLEELEKNDHPVTSNLPSLNHSKSVGNQLGHDDDSDADGEGDGQLQEKKVQ